MERTHEEAPPGERDRAEVKESPTPAGAGRGARALPVRPWIIVAGLCLVAAVLLWWRSHLSATFVVATLGVVAWFLDLRDRLQPGGREAGGAETRSSGDTITEYGDKEERHGL